MSEYKLIQVDSFPEDKKESVINLFNSLFSKKDVYLCGENENLNLYLREIDIRKLQNIVKAYPELAIILEKINSIRSYGINNGKRVYVDYNKERKVIKRKEKEKNRNAYFYAKNHNFSTINNELPLEFENKIICGDSEEVLKKLPDNCIDIVFTSPPYNFGLDYKNNYDANHWEKYFDKLFRIFEETIRIVKYGGRIIINVQPLFSDYIPTHHIISNFFISRKLIWKGEILWEKNNYNCKYTAWGSWKSPSNPYLKYTWEFLEIFCKGNLRHSGDKKNIDITAEEFKKYVVAKWNIAPERNMKKYGHPAMFPENLVKRVLKLFSFQEDVILDPFNGVGTTTAVAKKLNRRFLGIDISQKYCEVAKKRIFTEPEGSAKDFF